METLLSILDIIVVLAVVISLVRAVWKGRESLILSAFLTLVFAVFGLVSLLAASGLTGRSPFDQGALLVFLVVIAAAMRMSWAKQKTVSQP